MKNKPVFPIHLVEFTTHGVLEKTTYSPGMTLRQWYKGQATSAFVSGRNFSPEEVADFVSRVADALIKEDENYEQRNK